MRSLRFETRLSRIAKGLLTGKSIDEIAADENIHRNTAGTVARSEELRWILLDWVNQERRQLELLFYVGLAQIERGLFARREYCSKDGTITRGGPDYYARIAAFKALCAVTTAGRPALKAPEEKEEAREVTFADIERLVKSRQSQ